MARTGKKAGDIFASTTATKKRPEVGIEVPERVVGRPAVEPYQKVTVTLFNRQILHLDKVALAIRERTGQSVSRAELIRAVVDNAAGALDPEAAGFDQAVRDLFPALG